MQPGESKRRIASVTPHALAPLRPVIRAFLCAVVPEATALDETGWSEFERLMELALGDRSPAIQRQVRLFLRFIQWWPMVGYGRPFTALDPAQRARFLSSLEEHPVERIRLGFWGLRTLVLLGYYGQPEVQKAIGYAADARGWEAPR